MTDLFALLARAVALLSTVVITGAVIFRGALLQRWKTPHGVVSRSNGVVARTGAVAAGALALIAPARLYLQARNLVDVGDPVRPMMGNVLHTAWGRGLCVQTIAAVVALGAFTLARRASIGWVVAACGALALDAAPALMGHAIAAVHFLPLSVLSDWTHVIAAGGWAGTLLFLTVVAQSEAHGIDANGTADLIELFHPVALTCAGLLVASGGLTLVLRVDRLRDLLHSPYGAILGVKLGLTLLVATLGAYHARRGAQLARSGGTASVARTLIIETAIAAAVIITTALLVATSPPMSSNHDMPGMTENHSSQPLVYGKLRQSALSSASISYSQSEFKS